MKFILVLLLCIMSLVEMRRLPHYPQNGVYYPNTRDPDAIVFPGPTNERNVWDNEIEDDFPYELDIRFGSAEATDSTGDREGNSSAERGSERT